MDKQETVERRIVTVLFADLVGFTTLSEQFDPEDIAVIQDRYFAAVRETIDRYGGRLEKFIGDAAMAVFGVPRSRDDDAARAVRAGLALVHTIQRIGADLGLDDDALRLRVGVNTGEAVIAASGDDEGRVTGDTVNTAARLQTAAPPGGVLIGESTALAVADMADMEAVTALELKGKAGPTPAHVVAGLRAEPSREQAMGALRAPTLGRESELAALSDAHGRVADGALERWLVIAPPGVGKSRLLREFSDRVSADNAASVISRSRARPDSLSPFDPVARLMLDALGTAEQSDAQERFSRAVRAAGASELRAEVVVEACLSVIWPATTTGDSARQSKPTDERESLFAAWLEGLNALSGTASQLWLVEDVHWAGGDVLAFLDFAATAARSADSGGRLILATTRPSLLETNPDWATADTEKGRHVLHLPALEPTDARALVNALVGSVLPVELVDRIVERSDGNCLFIEELLRVWVSVGTLVSEDGSWRLTLPPEEIPLPASVQSIYAAQLDDLPPDARRLARRASVAGRRFPVRALAPLGAEADTGLQPLQRRELVVGPLTEPLWGEAYAYRHALLRDAGYASLARAERARLHVRLARWLEEAAGERSTEIAEQIASHYSSALESAPSLSREIDDGLDRDEVGLLAGQWYERAGQGTLSLSAHDAARQLFKRSIDLTPDDRRLEKARRWERLGDATAFAADMDEGAAAYQKAIELYREAIQKGSAGFDRGSAQMNRASEKLAKGAEWLATISPDGAEGLLKGAEELRSGADRIQEGKREFQEGMAAAQAGLARTSAELANVMYQQLKFADAKEMAASVRSELGEVDSGSQARLLVAEGMGALGAYGPSPETGDLLQRAIELAHESGDAYTELRAREALLAFHSEGGRYDISQWQALIDAARAAGNHVVEVSASINVAGSQGDDDAASVFEPIAKARELAQAYGMTDDVGWTYYIEAEAAFITGDWDRAVAVGTKAMDIGEANAYLRLTVRNIHVLVPISAVRGDMAMLERAAAFYRSLEGKFEFPDSPYSRVIRTAQDLELAAAGLWTPYVPEVEPRLVSFQDEPGGGSWSAALDRVLRGWLEAGELEGAGRALDAMEEALPRYTGVSHNGLGTFKLMRGRHALAVGNRDLARDHARSALEHFRICAAPWWIAKSIRLLERAGAADKQQVAEVEDIERRLGAVGPTA